MSDAIEDLEALAKGEARGGKYHRRVTQEGKHRYYYSPEAYARAHGDAAHISGADALQGKAMRASKKAKRMRKHPASEAQRRWAFAAEERGELPEGKALEWSRRVKAGTAPMSKSEDTMDAIAGLTRLIKSEGGFHKYKSKKMGAGGKWEYEYEAPGGGSVSKHPVEHFHETMRTLHSGASTKDKTPHPHAVAHALRAVIDHASTLPTQKAKNDLAKELDHHLSAARTHLTNMRNYAQRDRSGSHYKSPKDEARRITSADVNAAGNVRDLLDQAKGRIKEAGMSEEKKAATAEKKKAASAQRSKEYQAKQESGAKGSSAAHADYLRDRMEAVNEAARSTPGKTREEREARGSGVELATQMYRAHLNEHKKKHGSLPAGHTMPPEHERTRQKRAESEGQQRFAFSRRVDAISALAQLSKGGEGGSHKNVKKLKKSEGAHAMIESTPSIRKSFRGLDGAQPLAKGLYKFGDYSQNAKMQAIPDEYLLAYLDAFIEEATEHEMREKAHALDAMTMGPTPGGPEHSLAQWVMNELVSYMTCNANLMRAVKMCDCTKDYIADRISAMGLLKPLASHRTDHGDYLQGFMYSEEQEAGYVGKSYGPNTVLDESAMLKAVAHTRAAARAVDGSPVQFAADDPMQALGDFHRAQRARVQAYYGEGTARFDARAGEPLPKR